MQVLFHGLAKVCLFLCAGAIIHKTGSEYVRDTEGRMLTAGLAKRMPVLMWAFALAALSLIGLPPLAGKWQLMTGAFQAMGSWAWLGAGVLLISAVFTAGYLLDIVSSAFFMKSASAEDVHGGREPPEVKLPVIVPALLLLALGIFSIMYYDVFQYWGSALFRGV